MFPVQSEPETRIGRKHLVVRRLFERDACELFTAGALSARRAHGTGADHDGIRVWSGIPNWQNISFGKPEVYAKGVGMLKEMIRRDRNKASVILRSVFNETPNNPTRTKSLTDLAGEARRLDPKAAGWLQPQGLDR
jgi:hypothetical protein